jgi:hypothetical protein
MDRKAAKELLHIHGWLDRVDAIIQRGKEAYLADDLLQEAGDSLMMKLGEAANRLSRLGVLAPDGVDSGPAVSVRSANGGHWPWRTATSSSTSTTRSTAT